MRILSEENPKKIVLDNGDKFILATEANVDKNELMVTCDADKINVFDMSMESNRVPFNSEVQIDLQLSKEEIIALCDEWLSNFKNYFNEFKSLVLTVLTDKYRKEEMKMSVFFSHILSFSDCSLVGLKIGIELKKGGLLFQEGPSITIGIENREIIKYMIASVVDHYIKENYSGYSQIDNGLDWNFMLTCSNIYLSDRSYPFVCGVSPLYESYCYFGDLVNEIIYKHNLIQDTDELIQSLKDSITDQQIGKETYDSFTRARKQ